MHHFKNILVSIETDPISPELLERAAQFAHENDAALKLLAVMDEFPWYTRYVLPNAEELETVLNRHRLDALEEIATRLRSGGLDITTQVLRGRRHLELVREVLRGDHDLLIKQVESNDRMTFGSTDMHLLRACPCPLWLFRPEHAARGFSTILAAVDPAPISDETDLLQLNAGANLAAKDKLLDAKILDLACLIASKEDANLHVVHAWSAPGEEMLRGNVMLAQEQIDRYVAEVKAQSQKALGRLLEEISDRPHRFFVNLQKGDPVDIIAEFVKVHHVDLIVMGTVARTGISGFLIGNTAETILQRVDCSVLALKPDGFRSPVTLND